MRRNQLGAALELQLDISDALGGETLLAFNK